MTADQRTIEERLEWVQENIPPIFWIPLVPVMLVLALVFTLVMPGRVTKRYIEW